MNIYANIAAKQHFVKHLPYLSCDVVFKSVEDFTVVSAVIPGRKLSSSLPEKTEMTCHQPCSKIPRIDVL